MSTPDNGGPAFPVPITSDQPGQVVSACELGTGGMTLRDWFAGQALASLARNWGSSGGYSRDSDVAKDCYALADAMLAARKGTQ